MLQLNPTISNFICDNKTPCIRCNGICKACNGKGLSNYFSFKDNENHIIKCQVCLGEGKCHVYFTIKPNNTCINS